MRSSLRLIVGFGLVMGALSVARAEGGHGPCSDDIQKFCKDVKPGEGRLIGCLKQHESELSAGCKEHRAEAKAQAKEVHAVCEDDVERLCGDVKPGQGRLHKCLKDHMDQVSSGCKEKISQVKAERKASKGGATGNPPPPPTVPPK